MAITKDEFIQSAVNEIASYPTIAMRWQIGDPLISQGIASIAAMLADVSNQVEVTAGEPFTKARDVTVRSDAAVKGILPFGKASIAAIRVTNASLQAVRVLAGRSLQDAAGRYWVVTAGVSLGPGEVGTMTAKQVSSRGFTHQVTTNMPFYQIPFSGPELGYVAAVLVENFEYSTNFANIADGERVYNIKSDETGEMSLQFGIAGLSGYQPAVGEQINITIQDTEGAVSLSSGLKFYFEYTGGASDAMLVMELLEVSQAGSDPMDISTMREVCSYPGIYDDSAVFGSNFDFVVRKAISPVTFLSIWNETKEEMVRGANVDHMNRLFVAVRKAGSTQEVLYSEITAVIKRADDSYRIRFVPVVDVVVPLVVTLTIPTIFESGSVEQVVRSLLLKEYGAESVWAKRGGAQILEKDIYKLVRDNNVSALSARLGNMTIDSIGDDAPQLPEHYRYITPDSLQVLLREAV